MRRKDIKLRIKEYFFVNPLAKLRLREMERTLKLPLPSLERYTKELIEEGILKIMKIGNVKFYTADRSNENYIIEKRLFNIKQLYNSGLIKHIKEILNNPTIVVFGSYSKGEDTEESDIDIYIKSISKRKVDLRKFEKRLNRKIQLFTFKNLNQIENLHLKNNILNGIILNGYLEVFK